MSKKQKQRLTLYEKGILTVAAGTVLLICLCIFSPDNNPLHIFSPRPTPDPSAANIPAFIARPKGPWQKGDTQYDADTQAKLIALANVFYEANDKNERAVITDIANEIRHNAGEVGDDSLVEVTNVVLLGQSLDEALKQSDLTKELLLEKESPYVGITTSKSDPAGKRVTTYTFGKVDIEITRSCETVVFGSWCSVSYKITLTPKAHYSAYVFYNVGWENYCTDAVNAIEARGITVSNIGTASITSDYNFIDAWNSIDPISSGLSIPYVVIDTHGTPVELNNDRFAIFSDGIAQLQDKHIERLILLGCNVGHIDYKDTNPAAAFAKKIFGGFVLASDGTVYNIGADTSGSFQYESQDDNVFQSYIGTDGRSSLGWIVYQYASGQIVTYYTSAPTMTISDMLNCFDPIFIDGQY